MRCYLMNQNQPFLDVEFEQNEIKRINDIIDIKYAPLSIYNAKNDKNKILLKETNNWFKNRGIPLWRKELAQLLQKMNIESPTELLDKAHGLSLSDQYWVKDIHSDIEWKDINFFEHDFQFANFLEATLSPRSSNKQPEIHSPNNTTDGMLPKSWIIENGKRVLVKRTFEPSNQEPFNEWLASEISERLGFDYCPYKIDVIDNKLVSKCDNFLNKNQEIITAYDIYNTKQKLNHMNDFNHYVQILEEHGIENAHEQLENMIILDYLTMNYDRHMKNFGIIRNVQTLKWEKTTPLFDNGQSMNCNTITSQMNFNNGEGKLFYDTHKKFSKYPNLISDFSRFDFNKLNDLPGKFKDVLTIYKEYAYMDENRIDKLVNGLEIRIDKIKEAQKQRTKHWDLTSLLIRDSKSEMDEEVFESALISTVPKDKQNAFAKRLTDVEDIRSFAKDRWIQLKELEESTNIIHSTKNSCETDLDIK